MNYLTALLAFSAIMIVLTTLATVVVEFLHKLMRKRASDFEGLLEQLYTEAIKPTLETAGAEAASTATEFVEEITRNPAFKARKASWLGKHPKLAKFSMLGNLFDTSLQEMTTRQFVEQFADTEAGKKLQEKATDLSDDVVGELVTKLSYQFERYGQAATQYFKRRATVLSVMVAFLLAVLLNIETFKLFNALAQDDTLAQNVISNIDVSELEASYAKSLEVSAKAGDGRGDTIRREYEQVLESIKAESKNLGGLGLPIGFEYFPYCVESDGSANGRDEPIDERCKGLPSSAWETKLPWADPLPFVGKLRGLLTWCGRAFSNAYQRIFTQSGMGWLLSVLVSGGLIGLGAPFWFKTYQSIADFIPGIKSPDNAVIRQPQGGTGGSTPTKQRALAQPSATPADSPLATAWRMTAPARPPKDES